MSIIQEALKKVDRDYLKKETPAPKVAVKQNIAAPKIYTKTATQLLRKQERTAARRPIVILSAALMAALCLISFLFYAWHARLKNTAPSQSTASEPITGAQDVSPGPPKISPAIPEKVAPQPPLFVLNGVMHLDGRAQAIINGYILEEGDSVNGATILEINDNYVLLNINEARMKLGLNK